MAISGRLLADVRRFPSGCSGLLELYRIDARRVDGRTELQLPECPAPLLQGWRVQATGVLRRPLPAVHPLLPGSAERLDRQGSWSQLRVESIEVLQRPWTPLADLRRDVAQRLQQAVGPRRGGFLAALVLGSAQVQLPEDIRAAFRMAGLSHALAASGFHLSVLLGSVLMLARRWPPGLRLPLAATALLLFLCLAGAQPSVVRAVLMAAMALLIREAGHHSRPVGVLLLTLSGMLLLRPAWALSIGFQLSAAATAGLILTAPRLEKAVQAWLPDRCQGLAAALSIPVAALLWTLPLQLLHFGAMPLYALVANLLVAPLLAPLTLLAMLSALLVLVGAYGCAAPGAVACSSVGGPGDHHGQLDQPLAWGSTAHRTSPDVGGCPAGTGLAALVAGGRALSPLLVVDPLGNRAARPRPRAVGRWFGDGGAV